MQSTLFAPPGFIRRAQSAFPFNRFAPLAPGLVVASRYSRAVAAGEYHVSNTYPAVRGCERDGEREV